MSNDIEERLRSLLGQVTRTSHKWKEIEHVTHIPAASWVDFNRGKKRATAEMIGAVCRAWPEYAFWLSTGLADSEHGHLAPRCGEPIDAKTAYQIAALHERILKSAALDDPPMFAGRTQP